MEHRANPGDGTIRSFDMILAGLLTQYDRAETVREMRRGSRGNIYRLGHYLKASQGALDDVAGMLDRSDAEAIAAYRKALQEHFIFEAQRRGGEPEFALAPLRKLDRMLSAWVEQGKRPKYPVSKPEHRPNAHQQHFAGYDFTSGPSGTVIARGRVDTSAQGDHGADPLGDGRFRMVPSGDVVDFDERQRRLARFHKPNARTDYPVEQCVGCGEDVVVKRSRPGDVLCPSCVRKRGGVKAEPHRVAPRAVCAPCGGLGIVGPRGGPFAPCKACGGTGEAPEHSPNGGYYVWPVAPDGVTPLSGEGPYGPYDLWTAQQYARISATSGRHDRAVSYGLDPSGSSFRISQIYRARTGDPVITADY